HVRETATTQNPVVDNLEEKPVRLILGLAGIVQVAKLRDVVVERISKKRTKNEAKTTKPDTEWKSVEKTKSRQSPSVKKSTKVNPDKSKVKK
ncbi:hypothetical protein Tco_0581714, partial [Tanacetum coccineum]